MIFFVVNFLKSLNMSDKFDLLLTIICKCEGIRHQE
jgi:hypothetical protein